MFYYALPNNGSQVGINSTTRRMEEAERCEKIADEFATGFAEWLVSNCYCEDDHWWLIKVSGDVIKSSKELLEIYKKECNLQFKDRPQKMGFILTQKVMYIITYNILKRYTKCIL